jgi:sugar phosphate isomerase/epimerase
MSRRAGALLDRRTMLRRTGLTTASFLLLPHLAPLFAEPAKRLFKVGACDWSLDKRADLKCFDVAREIGLDGVQVSLGLPADDMKLRQPQVQQQYKEAAKAAGVALGGLAIGALNGVPYKSEPQAETWVNDSVAVAQALGVKVILLAFFGKGDLAGDEPGQTEVIRRLKLVAPKAEKAGVVLGLESWLSAEDTLRILDKVGSPAVKMYYDVGNSTERGYDVPKEIRALGTKHICEFHLKENGSLLGQGKANFAKVREAIEAIGYEGWLHIEGALPPKADLVTSHKSNLKFVRALFAAGGSSQRK